MGKLAGLIVLCLTFAASYRGAEPEPLPTSDELHGLYDDGQYQPLIQKLMRVLQLKGAAAQPYDRVDLLMLRGEAMLRLKQQAAATDAFNTAAKEATAVGSPAPGIPAAAPRKPDQIATARATAMLVRASRSFAYTPKIVAAGGKAAPISLLDADQRPAAFKALLADSKAELAPKAKASAHATTLAPIIDVVRSLGDLRAVERLVTRDTIESDAMLAQVATQASKLMSDAALAMGPKVGGISASAHTKIRHESRNDDNVAGHNVVRITVTYTLRGLINYDAQNLRQVMATCEQIVFTARDFQSVTAPAEAAQFKAVEARAMKVGTSAAETLNDDYSGVTSN